MFIPMCISKQPLLIFESKFLWQKLVETCFCQDGLNRGWQKLSNPDLARFLVINMLLIAWSDTGMYIVNMCDCDQWQLKYVNPAIIVQWKSEVGLTESESWLHRISKFLPKQIYCKQITTICLIQSNLLPMWGNFARINMNSINFYGFVSGVLFAFHLFEVTLL